MGSRSRNLFETIHTEGGLLPLDILKRAAAGDKDLPGLAPGNYHLFEGERINEAVNRSWNRLLGAWAGFQVTREKLEAKAPHTGLTRERWLSILFQELGYGRLEAAKAVEVEGKSYPISHHWQKSPIHLLGFNTDLDKRTKGTAGAAQQSPHSLVQEFLNRSDEHLWGFLSNGLQLRILRDNASLTRQAFVEFDLEAMMAGEAYSDFVLLWLLAHQSRVEPRGEPARPEACWLEEWTRVAQEQGTRALDHLRDGVEQAIMTLGAGFLAHPANGQLRDSLRAGSLATQNLYRELLRLVYRLLFLFVAEDRDILLLPKDRAEPWSRERYQEHYSMRRLRRLAERRRGTAHHDLYRAMRLVMEKLGDDRGCPELALPALASSLWSSNTIPHLSEADISNRKLLEAVRALAFTEQDRRLRPVDYRNLGTEELGSIYESLLELHPEINTDAATFKFRTAAGHERKTTGSYYTPSSLIRCLLDTALDPVLDEARKKKDPEKAILNLKVCDPACGSGHFLVAAGHRLARGLAAVRTGEEEPAPDPLRTALRDVISHCLYGVDINPMAVELCKVSLWLEAIDPGKPLSFLDHHIRCGNSLLGTTPALMAKGIPDDAFKPIEGDDKKMCSDLRKQNREERRGQTTMFTELVREPANRYGAIEKCMATVEALPDDTVAALHKKEKAFLQCAQSKETQDAKLIADAWCAAFVWPKKEGGPEPMTEGSFRRLSDNPASFPGGTREEIERLAEEYGFFHWHLSFPEVFHSTASAADENDVRGWDGGFDLVLGNPPWERIKLQEKEFFATSSPEIAGAPNSAARSRLIRQLDRTDPALYNGFLKARRRAEGASHLVRHSERYPLCGRGDINTYTVFAEVMRGIISSRGKVGCILPSGIATDDTTKHFFQDLVSTRSLDSFYEFENEGFFGAGQGHMVRFALCTMAGDAWASRETDFMFQGKNIADLADPQRHIPLSADDLKHLNPNTHTCPIFKTRRDAEIVKAIYRRVPILQKEGDPEESPWGVSFMAMLHMANDSHLFRTRQELEDEGWELAGNVFERDGGRYLPLYEAKMIHQFDHRYGDYGLLKDGARGHVLPTAPARSLQDPAYTPLPRYWVPESEVDSRLSERWPYGWLLGWRDVTDARASARTVIAGVVPQVGVGDKFLLMLPSQPPAMAAALLCNLNAFVLDYIARQKVAGLSLKYFTMKQFAVLDPRTYEQRCPWRLDFSVCRWILPYALELIGTASDMQRLTADLGYGGLPFRWDEHRRFLLRCELDAAFFHLYAVSRSDVDYIFETFPIVKRRDVKDHGEYRTKNLVLDIYGRMQKAIETGRPYQTLLNPPPADPRAAHPE